MRGLDPSAVRLRRVGVMSLLLELAGPALLAGFGFYAGDITLVVMATVWAAVTVLPALALRRAEVRINDTHIFMDPRLGRLGQLLKLEWGLPLAELKVDVVPGEGTLPRFLPWRTNALFLGEGGAHQITRLLDWCRLSVPGDYMNRASLAEALRDTDDALSVYLRFPLLRVLHERGVTIQLLSDELRASPENDELESQQASRERRQREVLLRRGGTAARRSRVDDKNNLLRHPGAVLTLLAMVAAGVYALVDSLFVLEEGVANLEALVWLPLLGLAIVSLFVGLVWRSELGRVEAAGLLVVGWLVFSVASYPLLIRAVQEVGDEPRMVDYRVMPGPTLVPLQEGWPEIVRFRPDDDYWGTVDEAVPYPLEMRRGPGEIFLVNVKRVQRSRADFHSRN